MDAEDMEAPKQRRRLTAWGIPEVRTSLAKVLGSELAAGGRPEDAESAEVCKSIVVLFHMVVKSEISFIWDHPLLNVNSNLLKDNGTVVLL